MEDILYIILAAAIGFVVGAKVSHIWQQFVFTEILKDLGVTDQQLKNLIKDAAATDDGDQLERLEIRIDEHQGQLYAYTLEDNRFLGQGKDREQLIEHLKLNLTNVRLIIQEENGGTLLQKNNG
jgi:hypothetical protein